MGTHFMMHADHRTLSVEVHEKDTYAVLRLDVREHDHLTTETSIFMDYGQLAQLLERLSVSARVIEATESPYRDKAVFTALAVAKADPEVRSLLQFHLGCMDDDDRAPEEQSVLCGIRKVVTGGDLLSCTELLGHQGPHTYVRLANAGS
jgi:hypothetical protein